MSKWFQNVIWYQIFPDRFYPSSDNLNGWNKEPDCFLSCNGDLKGIEKKLDYLENLFDGLENFGLYLNPIVLSRASNHKYWPENHDEIDPTFGTKKDLESLINSIHQKNGKVILDLVYNHTGLNHYAFLDILKNGQKSKYISWYRDIPLNGYEKIEIPCLQNYNDGKFENIKIINDPRLPSFDKQKESFINVWDDKYNFPIVNPQNYKNADDFEIVQNQPHFKLINIYKKPNYGAWFNLFELPQLDCSNEQVKEYLFKSALNWLEIGVDGFRLDVPDMLNDAHNFWADFRSYLEKNHKEEVYITGEIWVDEGISTSFVNDGKRFNSVMNYPLREAVLNFYSGQILKPTLDIPAFNGEISADELNEAILKNFNSYTKDALFSMFNSFSNHDTRRLTSILDFKKLKSCLIMQFSLPGCPSIYYGDEILTKGLSDPQNRKPMNWDVIDNFEKNPKSKDIFSFYQKLIKTRKNLKALSKGDFTPLMTHNDKKLYAFARIVQNSSTITIISKIEQNEDIVIDISKFKKQSWTCMLTNKVYEAQEDKIIIPKSDFNQNLGIILN